MASLPERIYCAFIKSRVLQKISARHLSPVHLYKAQQKSRRCDEARAMPNCSPLRLNWSREHWVKRVHLVSPKQGPCGRRPCLTRKWWASHLPADTRAAVARDPSTHRSRNSWLEIREVRIKTRTLIPSRHVRPRLIWRPYKFVPSNAMMDDLHFTERGKSG